MVQDKGNEIGRSRRRRNHAAHPRVDIRTGPSTTQSCRVMLGTVGFTPGEPPSSVCRSVLLIPSLWELVLPRVVPKAVTPSRRGALGFRLPPDLWRRELPPKWSWSAPGSPYPTPAPCSRP